jgi:sugar O-acyltransferase (sialic acid O-acetyltransferase NeuD family)
LSEPVIIVGAGGHGRVVADTLRASGIRVLGFTDIRAELLRTTVASLPVLGTDEALSAYPSAAILLANGIGSTDVPLLRRRVFEERKAAAYRFIIVVHPRAIVASSAVLQEGAQIMAGAVVQGGAVIGVDAVVNTGALVDHDCDVGAHCHLAPGCVLSGGVRLGEGSHVGTGACIIQDVTLGAGCMVAAGAVVVGDHRAGMRLAGVPARAMK